MQRLYFFEWAAIVGIKKRRPQKCTKAKRVSARRQQNMQEIVNRMQEIAGAGKWLISLCGSCYKCNREVQSIVQSNRLSRSLEQIGDLK
ncbi:hypothetical protein HMP0721_2173 [Pseudoramibacter alactolyticus ATCC 23263]|uniref:Uncharacterized protein n=1 Tax=Pseudoramibacter alactolyticus ATCC 23263 TaxID=887929 RepID=E6MJI8_9FIRM|nr:hypothetical protein [Pseudoramibacter alactolyticus]EFV00724.1 hypothetical protein HMP0721_2173 [Pseudoramibacter alactolyticus ATCC 23263]